VVIAVADYRTATDRIALTMLRNVTGQHSLDEVFKDRNTIDKAVRPIVHEVTDPWGVSVHTPGPGPFFSGNSQSLADTWTPKMCLTA